MSKFVIGLVGSFGSGCSFIANNYLKSIGFYYVSLSQLLKEEYAKENPELYAEEISRTDWQDYGNKIRESKGSGHLAELAVDIINNCTTDFVVVDSIRNPKEINVLKKQYVDMYIFGIFADPTTRWGRVKDRYNDDQGKFNKDEKRDRGEKIEYGQRVTDCFRLADVVIINEKAISNSNDAHKEMKAKIDTYISKFKGELKGNLPSEMESNMAMAYVSSMRSSCLKRKVGAVIVDENGNVFSSGYNEVPRLEKPCMNEYGECYRNYAKKDIEKNLPSTVDKTVIMGKLKLLEKCRSLHAEENAILNIVSYGSASVVKGATLYTTTYPCNLCANKIAQVKIKKIIYFEPYPVEEAKKTLEGGKVNQQMFEGITFNAYFKVYD